MLLRKTWFCSWPAWPRQTGSLWTANRTTLASCAPKQKARRVYGIFERQFRRYFGIALRRPGLTGLNLLQTLEIRLDNVVFRLGFASDRAQARQLVNHGHIMVNGHQADIPSMLLRPGDVVTVEEGSRKQDLLERDC